MLYALFINKYVFLNNCVLLMLFIVLNPSPRLINNVGTFQKESIKSKYKCIFTKVK